MENKGKLKAMFLIPSLIGVLIFMIPVRYGDAGLFDPNGSLTVIVKVIADALKDGIGYNNVAILCIAILTISASWR